MMSAVWRLRRLPARFRGRSCHDRRAGSRPRNAWRRRTRGHCWASDPFSMGRTPRGVFFSRFVPGFLVRAVVRVAKAFKSALFLVVFVLDRTSTAFFTLLPGLRSERRRRREKNNRGYPEQDERHTACWANSGAAPFAQSMTCVNEHFFTSCSRHTENRMDSHLPSIQPTCQ
jgi:hypothetical protein